MKVPSFGKKLNTVVYKKRVGAYIVIPKKQNKEFVLVQAPNGAYFLPGGEIEAEETKEEAINRELLEELGVTVQLNGYLGQAREYFFSRHRNTYFDHPGYFFSASSWLKVSEPLEKENTVCWVPIDEGVALLKRGSHRWAVEQWLAEMKKLN